MPVDFLHGVSGVIVFVALAMLCSVYSDCIWSQVGTTSSLHAMGCGHDKSWAEDGSTALKSPIGCQADLPGNRVLLGLAATNDP